MEGVVDTQRLTSSMSLIKPGWALGSLALTEHIVTG